jgi:hypothetical protein
MGSRFVEITGREFGGGGAESKKDGRFEDVYSDRDAELERTLPTRGRDV